MFKKTITTAAVLLSLGFGGAASAQENADQLKNLFQADASPSQFDVLDAATWVAPLKGIPGAVPQGKPSTWNPWKPQTWTMEAFLAPAPVPKLDITRPSGWVAFMQPGTYAGMMNPATYSQFMLPEFWAQLINPATYISWINPFEYAEFFNPMQYLQWMNPASYAAFMNPINYLEPANPVNYLVYANPKTYLEWFNPQAYSFKGMMNDENNGIDLFDPSTWVEGYTATFDPFDPISYTKN